MTMGEGLVLVSSITYGVKTSCAILHWSPKELERIVLE